MAMIRSGNTSPINVTDITVGDANPSTISVTEGKHYIISKVIASGNTISLTGCTVLTTHSIPTANGSVEQRAVIATGSSIQLSVSGGAGTGSASCFQLD